MNLPLAPFIFECLSRQLTKASARRSILILVCLLRLTFGSNVAQAVSDWELLGVPEGASQAEVSTAWRATAKRLHPDKNTDKARAHLEFLAARAAFVRLSDLAERHGVNTAPNNKSSNLNWRFYSVIPNADEFNTYSSHHEQALTILQIEKILNSGDGATFKKNMQDFIKSEPFNLSVIMVWLPFFSNQLIDYNDLVFLRENQSNTLESWLQNHNFLPTDIEPVWESILELQTFLVRYMKIVDSEIKSSNLLQREDLDGHYTQLSFNHIESLKAEFVIKIWRQSPSMTKFFSSIQELAIVTRRHDGRGVLNLNTPGRLDKEILREILRNVSTSEKLSLISSFSKLIRPYMYSIDDFTENYSIGDGLLSRYMEMMSVDEQISVIGDTFLPEAFEWIGWTVSPKSFHQEDEKTMVDSIYAFSEIIKKKKFKNGSDFVQLFKQLLKSNQSGDINDLSPRAYAQSTVSAIAKHRDVTKEDLAVMREEARKYFLMNIEKFNELSPTEKEIRSLMVALGWASDYGFLGISKNSLTELEQSEILSYASNRRHLDLLSKFFSIKISFMDSLAGRFKVFRPQQTTMKETIAKLEAEHFNSNHLQQMNGINFQSICSDSFKLIKAH